MLLSCFIIHPVYSVKFHMCQGFAYTVHALHGKKLIVFKQLGLWNVKEWMKEWIKQTKQTSMQTNKQINKYFKVVK